MLLWQDKKLLSLLLSKANHCAAEHLCRLQTPLRTNSTSKLTLSLRGRFIFHCWIEVERKERFSLPIQYQIMEEAKVNISPLSTAITSDGQWLLSIPAESWGHWEFHRGLSPSEILSFTVWNVFCESSAAVAAGAVTTQECWFSSYSVTMNESIDSN